MAGAADVDDGKGLPPAQAGSGYSSMPIPDPTVLTTQALYREVAALRELVEQRIASLAAAMANADEATRRTIHEAIEARNILDREVQLRTDLQFRLVEQQRVEQKKDTKDAVDAALSAAKEAVREQTIASSLATQKSETATNKQQDELAKRFETAFENLRRADDEIKERIAEVDRKASDLASQKLGATTDRTGLYATVGIVITLLLLGMTVIGFLAAQH
jgi:hypothetical protein